MVLLAASGLVVGKTSLGLRRDTGMTCLTMNSVYGPRGTFRPPNVSLPLSTPSVHQLSTPHFPLSFSHERLHFHALSPLEYSQSMQLIPSLSPAGHFVGKGLDEAKFHEVGEGEGPVSESAGATKAPTRIMALG